MYFSTRKRYRIYHRYSDLKSFELDGVMRNFKKKIVTDEAMRPVAVLIDYQDWAESRESFEKNELVQTWFLYNLQVIG
ncbi:hypothetical protein [Okeania sp. SIO1I7]|uniref:hypothetical protein n=1 Tax=Okeania sp. SIO1I7 TaxID=2607772 RepID=UPI0025DD5CB4|nr:hypothetical protein [Okeania sp. SIO1I7]